MKKMETGTVILNQMKTLLRGFWSGLQMAFAPHMAALYEWAFLIFFPFSWFRLCIAMFWTVVTIFIHRRAISRLWIRRKALINLLQYDKYCCYTRVSRVPNEGIAMRILCSLEEDDIKAITIHLLDELDTAKKEVAALKEANNIIKG